MVLSQQDANAAQSPDDEPELVAAYDSAVCIVSSGTVSGESERPEKAAASADIATPLRPLEELKIVAGNPSIFFTPSSVKALVASRARPDAVSSDTTTSIPPMEHRIKLTYVLEPPPPPKNRRPSLVEMPDNKKQKLRFPELSSPLKYKMKGPNSLHSFRPVEKEPLTVSCQTPAFKCPEVVYLPKLPSKGDDERDESMHIARPGFRLQPRTTTAFFISARSA